MTVIDQLFLNDSAALSPQGRAGRAVYLLMTTGPMGAAALTSELGYRSRFGIYDLMDNLAQSVPLYYDEGLGVYGILPQERT